MSLHTRLEQVWKQRSWELVHLDSKASYKEESNRMGHCIGEGNYYWEQAQNGTMKAFSLRLIENGLPYATINLAWSGGILPVNPEARARVIALQKKSPWMVEQCKLYCDALVGDDECPYLEEGEEEDQSVVQRIYPGTVTDESWEQPTVTQYVTEIRAGSYLLCELLHQVFEFLDVENPGYSGDLQWCQVEMWGDEEG